MSARYQTVVGLEVHAQLLTRTKLFCACSTQFGREPNSNVCPVCLGLPGALPVLNEAAVRLAARAALALGCRVQHRSVFARKNYFYPDLPKGYQISQYEEPLATGGLLEFEHEGQTHQVRIERVHMEEDAGKNVHGMGGDSMVDLNRAGVPLVEIVTAPDLRSSGEASAMMRALRELLVFLGVNDGNLEEGSLRCDANVSIRPSGSTELGTRCELKNLNSFRFVQRGIDVEVKRQSVLLDSGSRVEQQTRSFDPDTLTTHPLRSKEEAHDYRYFPEPDLPPLLVEQSLLAFERDQIVELPADIRRRWVEHVGLSSQAASTLTAHPRFVEYFEAARRVFDQPVALANFLQTEVLRDAKVHGLEVRFPVTPEQLAELLALVEDGTISGKQAKRVYSSIIDTDRSPRQVVEEQGIAKVSDRGALEPLCRALVEQYVDQARSIRAGKKSVLGFFVGRVMRETQGSADPRLVTEILEQLISELE